MRTTTARRQLARKQQLTLLLGWLVLFGVLLALPTGANAFQVKYTPNGEIIQWAENIVSYSIDPTFDGVQPSVAKAAVNAGFAVWTAVPSSYLQLKYEGALFGELEGYDQSGENNNIVRFEPETFRYDQTVLAVTLLTYESDTGVLRDADIIVNVASHDFTVDPPPGSGSHDIQNTIAHEAGHFVGLAHEVEDHTATMFPVAPSAETTKRTLSLDDEDGISYLYPAMDSRREPGSEPVPSPSSPEVPAARESLPNHSVRLERVELGLNCQSIPNRSGHQPALFLAVVCLSVFSRRRMHR